MATDTAERDEQDSKRTGPVQFFKEVRAEGRKITWATRQEVIGSTIIVLVLGTMAAIFFFVVDFILGFAIRSLIAL